MATNYDTSGPGGYDDTRVCQDNRAYYKGVQIINTVNKNRKYMDIPLSTNFIRKFLYKTIEFLRIKNNNNFVIRNHILGMDIFRST